MRAQLCNFALRNRLKSGRSPDVRDMLTSFLVRKSPSPVCRRSLEDKECDGLSAFLRTVAVQLCTMPDEPNSRSL